MFPRTIAPAALNRSSEHSAGAATGPMAVSPTAASSTRHARTPAHSISAGLALNGEALSSEGVASSCARLEAFSASSAADMRTSRPVSAKGPVSDCD